MTAGGAIAPRVSRDEALQVPAVLRARNLVAGTLATLPIHIHDKERRVATPTTLLEQIDPDLPNVVTFAQIYEDLMFESVSWMRVTERGWHGYPTAARHVPVRSVHVSGSGDLPSTMRITADIPFPAGGQVFIDGVPVRDEDVIRFDSPNPPLLRHAARAIRAALRLDQAAARMSDEPVPLGYLAPKEGVDPGTKEEIEEILNEWEDARRRRVWGYVGAAMELKTLQWNAEQMGLADQRQHAVLEIARAAGVDPEDLGVSTTSRTYQNAEHRRLDLLDFTLGAYVTAVQQRLSMRDVLPRGYFAKVKFDGFLRSTTTTRMDTYKVGKEVGAYTTEEIRELEDRPSLTPAETAQLPTKTSPAVSAPEQEPEMTETADSVTFTDDKDAARVTFAGDEVAASFRVNEEKRTVSGIAVPWGKTARSGFSKWKFAEGSLHWSGDTRVKMNVDHDHGQTIGRGVRLQSTSPGLDVTFKVARGAEGDKALAYADDGVYDGFSIEVTFDGEADGWTSDPQDESVRLVHSATLRAVALTAMPAFDDARVAAVAASREGVTTMGETKVAATVTPDAAFDFSEYMTGLGEKIAESHTNLTKQLSESLGESISAGFKTALESMPNPQDGPQTVRAARYTVTRESPVYAFNGGGNSLVRDAWYAGREHDHDAVERLRKYRSQSEEIAKLASAASFATSSTANAAEIIPPGYRPDLYIPELTQGRPLVSATSRGTIANATPFTVPVFGSSSGATADHVEGTNPTDGTLTFATKTVTPQGLSGKMILTRELVDSSNPAIDQIALATMRESYARQTESKVYTLLNGTDGAGGVITGDFVPSGAQASTVVAAETDAGSQALVKHIRERLAKYPFNRFASPSLALMGQNATTRLATATDNDGRPLFPSVGAQNTNGVGNAITQGWFIDGLTFQPAWAMTGEAAGDSQFLLLNMSDAWVWESPLLTFQYLEKSGPALIELALFGYFGTHLLRPVGLSGIRVTTV